MQLLRQQAARSALVTTVTFTVTVTGNSGTTCQITVIAFDKGAPVLSYPPDQPQPIDAENSYSVVIDNGNEVLTATNNTPSGGQLNVCSTSILDVQLIQRTSTDAKQSGAVLNSIQGGSCTTTTWTHKHTSHRHSQSANSHRTLAQWQ